MPTTVGSPALYCAHRATTASSWGLGEQKGHLAAPLHPSEAARCASTEDHQAPSPPLLREQGISTGVIPPLYLVRPVPVVPAMTTTCVREAKA